MLNKNFTELLQVSVGTRDRLSHVLTDKEWDGVYSLAEKQGLIGVMFGGVEKLPKEQTPYIDLLMDWLGLTEYLKTQNEQANKRCEEITEMFAQDGYRSCILKGQANALYYPKPELRSSGDIDIWVEGDRKKVARYVMEREKDYIRMQFHHIDYHVFKEVDVEVHFCPMILFNFKKNEILQRKFRAEMDFCFQNWNEMHTFCSLTFMPNVLMQLVHMYRHIFDGGLGMKQILDFYYLLVEIKKKQGVTSYNQLRQDVKEIGLTDFCGGVCYVIKELLLNGTDDSLLIVEPNKKHGRLLMHELEKWHDDIDYNAPTKDATSKMGNFFGSIVTNSRLWRYYPSDCLWNIIYRLAQYAWRKKNGWK